MSVSPHVRAVTRAAVDDLAWIGHLLDAAGEIEWVSDAAALYAARLSDASRMVAYVEARARSAETALARVAARA